MSPFDESDMDLMDSVSDSLAKLVTQIFPDTLDIDGVTFTRKCVGQHKVEFYMVSRLVRVIDECMGDLYVKHKGENWRDEKIDELTESGLVTVWYADGVEMCGFMAFKLALELYGKCLYLYEVQVLPKYQGKRIGSIFMDLFHRFASAVNECSTNSMIPNHSLLDTTATSLTVFSDNERACEWYYRHGYVPTADSPCDKVMRDRIIKPSFYLLTRPLQQYSST